MAPPTAVSQMRYDARRAISALMCEFGTKLIQNSGDGQLDSADNLVALGGMLTHYHTELNRHLYKIAVLDELEERNTPVGNPVGVLVGTTAEGRVATFAPEDGRRIEHRS